MTTSHKDDYPFGQGAYFLDCTCETPTPEAEGIELDFPHQDDNYWIMIEVGGVKVPQYPSPLEVKMLIEEQLQKARHDWLREEIVRLGGIKTSFVPADSVWFGKDDYSEGEYKLVPSKDPSKAMYCLTCERFLPEEGCNCGTVELQTIIDRYQAELDQDKVCEVCHGHGNNGADDAQCLNCGGSGLDQDVSK